MGACLILPPTRRIFLSSRTGLRELIWLVRWTLLPFFSLLISPEYTWDWALRVHRRSASSISDKLNGPDRRTFLEELLTNRHTQAVTLRSRCHDDILLGSMKSSSELNVNALHTSIFTSRSSTGSASGTLFGGQKWSCWLRKLGP